MLEKAIEAPAKAHTARQGDQSDCERKCLEREQNTAREKTALNQAVVARLMKSFERECSELRSLLANEERLKRHWKSNHDCQVQAARFLRERADVPADRVSTYDNYVALLGEVGALRTRCEMQRKELEAANAVLRSKMFGEKVDARKDD